MQNQSNSLITFDTQLNRSNITIMIIIIINIIIITFMPVHWLYCITTFLSFRTWIM